MVLELLLGLALVHDWIVVQNYIDVVFSLRVADNVECWRHWNLG